MTPQTHAKLACGATVRITVTLADSGAEVTAFDADTLAVDGYTHKLFVLTDDGVRIVLPLEPVEPTTALPLPRPLRGAR